MTEQWFGQVKEHVSDKMFPCVHIYKSNNRLDGNVLEIVDVISKSIHGHAEMISTHSFCSNKLRGTSLSVLE